MDAGAGAKEPEIIFQPLVILPAQHFDPPRKLAPEHRLMMAVLDAAVWCIDKYRVPTDTHGRRSQPFLNDGL